MLQDQLPDNINPTVFVERFKNNAPVLLDEDDLNDFDKDGDGGNMYEYFDAREIFDHIRNINDPEHPLTLEQLNVVNLKDILVEDPGDTIVVQFTPTIPHCSMATLIGLCLRVKLLRVLPMRFKVTIKIFPGAHQSEAAINKQLTPSQLL